MRHLSDGSSLARFSLGNIFAFADAISAGMRLSAFELDNDIRVAYRLRSILPTLYRHLLTHYLIERDAYKFPLSIAFCLHFGFICLNFEYDARFIASMPPICTTSQLL